MRLPGVRAYGLPQDLVWDTARGGTAGTLRQRVADFYSLPVEKIEVAKYFPEKFEWLPVSSWVRLRGFLETQGAAMCQIGLHCEFEVEFFTQDA